MENVDSLAGSVNNLLEVGSNEELATNLEQNNVAITNR